jgi:tetratricopeptide (TPR) repeat protein
LRKRLDVAAMRGLTPFVGRKTEIEIFEQLLEQASRGHGQILSMMGEPGVGKSRLIYELIHSHRNLPWRVLDAMSVSYGQASPYFPLIALLKNYFEIEEGDKPGAIQAKVQRCILRLDENLKDAIPPLLALLEALPEEQKNIAPCELASTDDTLDIVDAVAGFRELGPRQRRESTLAALKRILIHESQRQPLVLVFEDLHWIDNETQAFLDSFVENLPAARILLLVNYRPSYKHRWANKTYYTHLRLDPLPPNRAGELLEHLLGADSALGSLKQHLIERTEGNPFFLEESVRTLAETNVLIGGKGAYKLARDGAAIRIPKTVQAVLADRIDRLPPDEKHVLQTAAVIGMTAPVRLLRAVAELSDEVLRRALDALQAAELLHETNLFPEVEYTFKHALTNEVVYEALLQDHRKTLHSRIVHVLEETQENSGSDQIEKLARHSFRGELWDKAVPYLKEAGMKAMGRSANREAVVFLEQAVAALQHLPQRRETLELAVDLRLDLRNAVFLLGEIGRIPRYLDEAQKAAEILNDKHRLQRVLNFRIAYLSMTGEPDRAIEIGEAGLGSGLACDDPGAAIVTHYYMGIVYYTTGNYHEAMRVLTQAMEMADEGDLKFERFGTSTIVSAICRTWIVQSLAQTGAFDEAIARGEEGVIIAEQARHPYTLGYVNCSLGLLYLLKGDLDAAVEKLQRSLKLCREANIRVLFPQIASYLGFAYALSDRTADALPLMEEAEEQTISIGRRGGQSLRLAWQGETYLLSGRIKEAVALAERAYELSEKHKERGHHAWTLRLMAEISARNANGGFAEAESLYTNSLELARELGMAPLRAHCHLGLGQLFLRAGLIVKSRIELSRACELYRDMKMTLWLARAESALQKAAGPSAVRPRKLIKTS